MMMVLQTETTEESAAVGPVTIKRRYNPGGRDRPWLRYDCEQGVMYCVWCRDYDKNTKRNQFVKRCSSMKVESIKKNTKLKGSTKIPNLRIC